jgi:hypothetical protein
VIEEFEGVLVGNGFSWIESERWITLSKDDDDIRIPITDLSIAIGDIEAGINPITGMSLYDHDQDDHAEEMGEYLYSDEEECKICGAHLGYCDEDGYCNYCGHQ